MEAVITGRTRGGSEWVPQFVTAVDAQKCIGCGRCYKVCPRDVFELVERSGWWTRTTTSTTRTTR
ncbi:4Fe-4S binding protein [Stutzerimonas azotifigens]|uniref:4Fe-4S binding protein n=1 Tax=Stutzerimonas azotifigens TaxID=291995 RepID=UPI001F1FC4BB|nr:4Fe-4S binding protein [Stutzerimonas azotifigens]